jgi:hypothetical protein
VTSRIHRLADAASQFLNVLLFNGEANHSVSGDAYRLKRARLQRAIDWVFGLFGEQEHCLASYLADVQRAQELLNEHRNHDL